MTTIENMTQITPNSIPNAIEKTPNEVNKSMSLTDYIVLTWRYCIAIDNLVLLYQGLQMAITIIGNTLRLIFRILANILIMFLGWTIDDDVTQDFSLVQNASIVTISPSGKWNTAMVMLYRIILGISSPFFSSNAPEENTLLGKIISYLFNYRNLTHINSYDKPYYLEANDVSVKLILPNIGIPAWVTMDYNKLNIKITNNPISTDQRKIGIPFGSVGILTSRFNWKTMLFGVFTIYSMLFVLGFFWTFPIAMVMWAIWRNTLLMVNQITMPLDIQFKNQSINRLVMKKPSSDETWPDRLYQEKETIVITSNNPIMSLDTENIKHLD